uniref:Uncharacterized protein n=1 Tax=Terrapene triunguis TaxID=2587831 RepID=A0A674J9V7_9SAUR
MDFDQKAGSQPPHTPDAEEKAPLRHLEAKKQCKHERMTVEIQKREKKDAEEVDERATLLFINLFSPILSPMRHYPHPKHAVSAAPAGQEALRDPKSKLGPLSFNLSATCALYEMISVSKSKDATTRLYPQLLMALLVEIHFSLGQMNPSLPDRPTMRGLLALSHAGVLFESSSAVEAIKMLLLCVGCRSEVTVMEKEQGWILLQSPQDHLHGVSLLARAMVHYTCPETIRMLLDLVIPLLDRGDKKHRLTMTASFVELLHYKEAKKLPHPDTLDRLEEWTKHPSPVFRSLGLRGLGILATQPGKVRAQAWLTGKRRGSGGAVRGREVGGSGLGAGLPPPMECPLFESSDMVTLILPHANYPSSIPVPSWRDHSWCCHKGRP